MAERLPHDGRAYRGLVSVRGVVLNCGAAALLRNERDEWELPGGKLEMHETPEECLAREIEEELGLSVAIGPLLDAWLYRDIGPGAPIFIVTYGCHAAPSRSARLSDEHRAVGWFSLSDLPGLPMPEGYRRSIRAWALDPRAAMGLA